MTNVTQIKRKHRLSFRPIHDDVLRLMGAANEAASLDPVQTYGDLLTAAMLAGRFIGLTADEISKHVSSAMPTCTAAINARPDIFGGMKR